MPARGRTGGSSACVINAQPTPGSVQTLHYLGCDHRTGRPRSTAKPSELRSPWIASVVAATAATATGAAGTEGIATAVAAAIAAVLPAAGAGTTLTATTGAISTAVAATAAITTAVTTTSVTAATAIAAAITTAAVAAPTGATIAAAAVATTTAATGAAGFGFVDAQRTAHQLGALEGVDGAGLTVFISQLHEGEAALAAGVALEGQEAVGHLAERCEQLGHVLLFRAEGEVSYKNAHRPRGPIRQNFSARRLSRLWQFGGLHATADNRNRARSSCNRTWSNAVPPSLRRAATTWRG